MVRLKINHILGNARINQIALIRGWVRTRRDSKTFSFLEINDGSCLTNLQVIITNTLPNYGEIIKIGIGAAVEVQGSIVASQGQGQTWEMMANQITVLGQSPADYPLQKKRHSDEFLRTIAHLRARTNKYGAIFRIRSQMAFAVHRFFQDRGFQYIHTPILTASDCEGAGEMFRVITANTVGGAGETEFFDRPAHLTVSGQLEAELLALALGDVYTFGPAFRAENSNTRRHASEFWMIEPEMAFADLDATIILAEEMTRSLILHALEKCSEDITLFARFVDKNLLPTLRNAIETQFERIAYRDAVDILLKSGQQFEFAVDYGRDLQSEHERFLTEKYFKKPVIVFNFPKSIKPFYMRLNEDNETVASMDLLVPGIGEIIGGSQREERYDLLLKRMSDLGLSKDSYWWYLDSRRYASVFHSGYGMGFERLLMFVTGISNIRDVIAFPRTPKNIDF